MAILNPQATEQKLLLLKGTREKLATLDYTPGAIYFTTDYPGIYVDFAAEGDQAARRVRMGDVTIVDTLDELKNLAESAITAGQKLGKETLYYAKDKNVLCIYDEDENKFVWINDTSILAQKISTLEGQIGGINDNATQIANIKDSIGGSYSKNNTVAADIQSVKNSIGESSDNKDAATVYGAIALETYNRIEAIEALDDKIDELISGSNGTTIAGLAKDIEDLKSADTQLDNRLDDLEDPNTGVERNTIVSISRNDVALTPDTTRNVNINVIDKIKVNGAELTEATDHSVDITVPTKFTDLTDDSGFGGDITANTNLIKRVYSGLDSGTIPAVGADNLKTITGNAQAITNLKGDANTANTVLGNAKQITNLKGDANTANTVLGNAQAIADLKGDANTANTVLGNANAITVTNTRIDNLFDSYENVAAAVKEAKDYTDQEIDNLEKAINDTIADANAMTFKGTVSGINLPWWETNNSVNAGDTYVVSADITQNENESSGLSKIEMHIGDLLVAAKDLLITANESSDDYPKGIVSAGGSTTSTNIGWYHISTGYVDAAEPTLNVANNKVTLLSHAGTNKGEVTLSSSNQNIEITTSGTAISFNLVWATF